VRDFRTTNYIIVALVSRRIKNLKGARMTFFPVYTISMGEKWDEECQI
jgi:hypothetical protein